jgi:hypothetical protein
MTNWKDKGDVSRHRREYYLKNKDKINRKNKEYYLAHKKEIKEYRNTYLIDNKESIRERSIKYYRENKENILSIQNKYLETNKEKRRETSKKYYQHNKDKIIKSRKEYWDKNKDNPEYIKHKKDYYKKYYQEKLKNNLRHKIKSRISSVVKDAINRYINLNRISTSKKYNIDYKAIIEHLKPFPEDIQNYHIDHIVPLDFFDLTKEIQLDLVCSPINFQWKPIKYNLSKSNIIDFEKYPEQKVVWEKLNLNDIKNNRFINNKNLCLDNGKK